MRTLSDDHSNDGDGASPLKSPATRTPDGDGDSAAGLPFPAPRTPNDDEGDSDPTAATMMTATGLRHI